MKFEWHGTKAATNLRKHGVSFDEAATVFADGLAYVSSRIRTIQMMKPAS